MLKVAYLKPPTPPLSAILNLQEFCSFADYRTAGFVGLRNVLEGVNESHVYVLKQFNIELCI